MDQSYVVRVKQEDWCFFVAKATRSVRRRTVKKREVQNWRIGVSSIRLNKYSKVMGNLFFFFFNAQALAAPLDAITVATGSAIVATGSVVTAFPTGCKMLGTPRRPYTFRETAKRQITCSCQRQPIHAAEHVGKVESPKLKKRKRKKERKK